MTNTELKLSRQEFAEIADKLDLSEKAREIGFQAINGSKKWYLWSFRFLCFYGLTLLLSGVVFFFAYNWADLGDFQKFAVLEMGFFISVLAAFFIPRGHLIEKLALTSAFMFMGVFMAVFGQIYQTGANSWELFFNWGMLGLGLVLLARFSGLWLLWAVVINVAIVTFIDQEYAHLRISSLWIYSVLMVFNGCFLAVREYGAWKGLPELQTFWLRYIPLIAALAASCSTFIYTMFESLFVQSTILYEVGLGLAFAVIGVGWYYFHQIKYDIVALSFLALAALITFNAFVVKMVAKSGNEIAALLLITIVVLTSFSAVVIALRKIHTKREAGQ